MNIYAQILIDAARRRGIAVEILDPERNLFRLHGQGRSITCWESLTEKTSAIAFTTCADKRLTHRVLAAAGFRVPRQHTVTDIDAAVAFMQRCGRVVVKPADGEQGKGITVDISTRAELEQAVVRARRYDATVIVEEFVSGRDLRIIVIDHRFVAAIERLAARVRGDGRRTLRALIEERNRELAAQTAGESRIPVDAETERCIVAAGHAWDAVPPAGASVQVRKTANFHTGGTIRDVTAAIGPRLRRIAEQASRVLNIGVVGFDFLAPDGSGREYVIIEANERPGLANHEPQPTAERFIDYLFPETAADAAMAGALSSPQPDRAGTHRDGGD